MIIESRLGDLVNIRTGKLDANASSDNGKYPFFTCSIMPLRIDNYSYDCECVLVAGNGDLNVKYYNGKFDAYQRTYIIEVKDKLKVNTKYLYYYMSKYIEVLRNQSIGGVIKYIKLANLTEAKIPIISLDKQIKIIEILDLAQMIIEKRKKSIELLDELVKSKFIEMFGDLKYNSKKWSILNFNDFAIIDTNMTKDFETYKEYPHIGIDSIEKNTGNILEYSLVKDCNLKSGKYIFDERHIIYSKIRPNLNKVALPNFKGLCSADSYPILCNKGIIERSYLGYVLRSEFFLNYILNFSGRTNIPKVNKEQLKGFNMPVPPIELQNQFADFVKQVDKLKFEMEHSLKELEDNFNSLMQKAFKGELFN